MDTPGTISTPSPYGVRFRLSTTHSTSVRSNRGSIVPPSGFLAWALRTSSRWMRALSRSMTLRTSAVAGVAYIGPR